MVLSRQTYFREKEGMNWRERRWGKKVGGTLQVSCLIQSWPAELPWWLRGGESACQCRRHGFNPWCRKSPHAAEQLSSCARHNCRVCALKPTSCTPEPTRPRARAPHNERPPQWEARTPKAQHSQNKEREFKSDDGNKAGLQPAWSVVQVDGVLGSTLLKQGPQLVPGIRSPAFLQIIHKSEGYT